MNATGWKVGWAIGPNRILKLPAIINNTVSYCTNVPAQVAMSKVLKFTEEAVDGQLSFVE